MENTVWPIQASRGEAMPWQTDKGEKTPVESDKGPARNNTARPPARTVLYVLSTAASLPIRAQQTHLARTDIKQKEGERAGAGRERRAKSLIRSRSFGFFGPLSFSPIAFFPLFFFLLQYPFFFPQNPIQYVALQYVVVVS